MTKRRAVGSIRPEGRDFVGRYTGAEGRRQKVILGTVAELRTVTAARREFDRRLELLGITAGTARRVRLADVLAVYLARRVAILKPNSRAVFRSYGRHVERELGDRLVDQIDAETLQGLIAALYARDLSATTVRSIVSLLLRVLRAARKQGIAAVVIERRDLEFPRDARPPAEPRCFSIDESRRILEAAEFPWRALYALCAYLGLRIGEALGLEWQHLDFRGRQVRICQQATCGRLSALKSKNSATEIPLPDALAELLTAYRPAWRPNDRGLLFASRRGTPLWSAGVRRAHLHPLLERLGIPRGGFHSWRHALATEAFRAGNGAAAVRQLLRHSGISVTMRYSRVSFDDIRRGSDSVAALLSAPTKSATPNTDASGIAAI